VPDIQLVQEPPRPLVGVRRQVPVTELPAYFAEVLPKVMRWVQSQGVQPASMPMAMWCAMDMDSGIADCHAGCLVAHAVQGEGEITPGTTAGGDVLVTTHKGPYDTVGQSWQAVYKRAAELGRTPGAGYEIYVDDPTDTPAAELRTEIHLPLQG